MSNPLVSVVVCTYNAGAYLRPSVESLLSQSYRTLEILIVDDGSTDGSVEALRCAINDPRIRWHYQSNAGKPAALNRAMTLLQGQYYVIHDADDISHPKRIKRLVAAMEANQDLAAVYSGHEVIVHGRAMAPRARHKSPTDCERDIASFRMPAHDPTGMYRVDLLRDLEYDESLPVVEGYDYILRVGERWPMMVLGECLYGYRIHPESVTRSNPDRRDRLVAEVIRRACVRRGIDYDVSRSEQSARRMRRTRDGEKYGLAAHFIESAVDLRRAGQKADAFRTAWQAICLDPRSFDYYKPMLYSIIPPRVLNRLRRTLRP